MKATAASVLVILGLVSPPEQLLAQPAAGLKRIGILGQTLKHLSLGVEPFRETLRDFGYVEGKTIAYEYRGAAANDLERAAQDLLGSGVDLVVATGTPAALAAQRASATVPIVFYSADPVGSGLAASLARPGKNATGIATLSDETGSKRLELVKELLPRATRVAVLANLENPTSGVQLKTIESAARTLGLKLRILGARGGQDLERTLAVVTHRQFDAMIILSDNVLVAHYPLIAARALKGGVASISAHRDLPQAGGLMSYGADPRALWRQCAVYADRILKGAKPADLPIEQPTKFELVVNLKTAKALRLKIPESILLRADEVIR